MNLCKSVKSLQGRIAESLLHTPKPQRLGQRSQISASSTLITGPRNNVKKDYPVEKIKLLGKAENSRCMGNHNVTVGVSLSNRALIFMPDSYSIDTVLNLARYIEDSGYDSIWLGDGFLDKPRWDPIVMHASIAAITKRVRLGTATLNIDFRKPLQFARDWATLDQISKGRTVLGMGIGHSTSEVSIEREMQTAGNGDLIHLQGTMMEEWAELTRALWTEDKVTYSGKCFNYNDIWCEPKPYNKISPAILMAAAFPNQPKGFILRRLARVADGWIVNGGTVPELYAEVWSRVKGFLREYGRDPNKFETVYQVTGAIGKELSTLRQDMTQWLKAYYRGNYHYDNLEWWGPVGDADRWINWIGRCADAGVKTFVVRFAGKKIGEQLEYFSRHVYPSL